MGGSGQADAAGAALDVDEPDDPLPEDPLPDDPLPEDPLPDDVDAAAGAGPDVDVVEDVLDDEDELVVRELERASLR